MRVLLTFLALCFGGLTVLAAVGLAVVVREAWSVRDAPLAATAAEAVALQKSALSAWVQLTDVSADCQRYAVFESRLDDGTVRKSSAFVAVNTAKDIEIAVAAHDVGACEHLGRVHFIGVIKPMDGEERRKFAADGLPLSETHGPQYWLCTWCVPSDERAAQVTLAIMTSVLVIAMAYTTRKLWRARNPSKPPLKTGPQPGPRAGRKEKRAKKTQQ